MMRHRVFTNKVVARRVTFGLIVLAICAGAIASAAFAGQTGEHAENALPTDVGLERVKTIAGDQSLEAGDAVPASIQVVTGGDLRDAMEVMDPGMTMPRTSSVSQEAVIESPAYLVVMTGSFTLNSARVPYGRPVPTGAVFELVIEAGTGKVVGRYIGNEISGDIGQLGSIVSLG